MGLKITPHAVYDTKYHLVWVPKYRKWMFRGDIRECVKQIFEEISNTHGFEIDTMEIADDHVHIFLSFPPGYGISKVVGMLKSISASVIFRDHPEVKKHLWGKVTAEVIRKHIAYHRHQEVTPQQLELF
jgi:putative transposase